LSKLAKTGGGLEKRKGVNLKTAELIGFSLLKDDKNVYYMDEKIENADIMSFKVLNENYAKDKNRSYEYLTKDEWK